MPIQVVRAFKKLLCLNYLQHSKIANCEQDFGELLSKFREPPTQIVDILNEVNKEDNPLVIVDVPNEQLSLPAKNALTYVCGYLMTRCLQVHSCDVCQNYAKSRNSSFDSQLIYCHFKAYENSIDLMYGSLIAPPEDFGKYIQSLEDMFIDNINRFFLSKPFGKTLVDNLKTVTACNFPCSKFPKDFSISLFARFRTFSALKFYNRMLLEDKSNQKKLKKIRKLTILQNK